MCFKIKIYKNLIDSEHPFLLTFNLHGSVATVLAVFKQYSMKTLIQGEIWMVVQYIIIQMKSEYFPCACMETMINEELVIYFLLVSLRCIKSID